MRQDHFTFDIDLQHTLKNLAKFEGDIDLQFAQIVYPYLSKQDIFTDFLCHVPKLSRRQYYLDYFFTNWQTMNRGAVFTPTYLAQISFEVANTVVPPWSSKYDSPDILMNQQQLTEEIKSTFKLVVDKSLTKELTALKQCEGEISSTQVPPIIDDHLRQGYNLAIFLSHIENKSQRKYVHEYFNTTSSDHVIKLAFIVANKVCPPTSLFNNTAMSSAILPDTADDLHNKIASRYYFKFIFPDEFVKFKALTIDKCSKHNYISNISRLLLAFHSPVKFFFKPDGQLNLTEENCYLPKELWLMILDIVIHDQYVGLYPNIKINLYDLGHMFDKLDNLWPIPVKTSDLNHKQK